MSRQADELVAAIRARRGPVTQAVTGLGSAGEIARRVRRNPVAWIVGGTAVGLASGRFLLPLLRAGKRRFSTAATGRLAEAAVDIATSIVGSRGARRDDTAPSNHDDARTSGGSTRP